MGIFVQPISTSSSILMNVERIVWYRRIHWTNGNEQELKILIILEK
jgi:hypothetical protein